MPAITANEQNLGKIFSSAYEFEIPPYQRPYAWTTENAEMLLEDILEAMTDGKEIYFLGGIVLVKDEDKPKAEVIDGQQRLTTLTILFCVLRELLGDNDTADQIHNYIHEEGRELEGIQGHYRLSMRKRDQEFFQQNVQTRGNLVRFLDEDSANFTDSRLRIQENANYLWEKLNRDKAQAKQLATYLVQNCFLVTVATDDLASAYRIFAVMNDRGLDLSPTDILKARIIGKIPEENRPHYTDKWEVIEDDLGRDEFGDLFIHIRMICAKRKRKGILIEEFEDATIKNGDHAGFIDNTLEPLAGWYNVITKAGYVSTSGAEKINAYLRNLAWVDNSDWLPPAIYYFDKHQNDKEALLRFVRDLDRLAYGMFIIRTNFNWRVARYVLLLNAIEKGGDLYAPDSPLQLTDEEKKKIKEVLDGPIYDIPRVPLPLLRRVNAFLAESGVIYDPKLLSVEHVLPQNPNPDSEWMENFTDDEREYWTNRLANLVLLSRTKNSQAQNYDFSKKKDKYFRNQSVTTAEITVEVLDKDNWTPDVLRQRQKDLLDMLEKRWRLN